MPIYEFQCDDCGHQFEMLQKINEELPTCAACHNSNVRKLVSSPSFQLKGSGWYKSDYKNTTQKTDVNSTDSNNKTIKKEESSNSDNNKNSKTETTADTTATNKSSVKDAA